MPKKVYNVKIKVYLDAIQKIFAGNTELGTLDNPYPADSFFEIKCPGANFWGPLKNVLVIENDATYQWSVDSSDDTPISIPDSENAYIQFAMLVPDADDNKWKKIFSDAPEMDPVSKKIKVKPQQKNNELFVLNSAVDLTPTVPLKYSILFKFEDSKGNTKYGLIDPISETMPPPVYP